MSLADIDVAILCGGKGTRARSYLGDTPKVLAPIKGRPLIEHLLEYLAGFGFERIWLISGHGFDQVCRWAADYPAGDLVIKVVNDKIRDGGWGALRELAVKFEREVLVLNGDTLLKGNLGKLAGYSSGNPISYTVRGIPSGVVKFWRAHFELDPLIAVQSEVLTGLDFLDIGTPEGYARAEAFLGQTADREHSIM